MRLHWVEFACMAADLYIPGATTLESVDIELEKMMKMGIVNIVNKGY